MDVAGGCWRSSSASACLVPGSASAQAPSRSRTRAYRQSRKPNSRAPPRSPRSSSFRILPTIPVAHDRPVFNVQMVNAALLPRDKEGIWVLDFSFKPLRIKTVDIPGKGRRQVHYLYYKVVNRTGKPRMFVPEFIMVNEADRSSRTTSSPRRSR